MFFLFPVLFAAFPVVNSHFQALFEKAPALREPKSRVGVLGTAIVVHAVHFTYIGICRRDMPVSK